LTNRLVIENLKHRPVRTLLSIIAIALQVTMVLTLVGVSRGMLDDQKRRSRSVGADILVHATSSSIISMTTNIKAQFVNLLRQQPHVVATTGVLVQQTGFLSYVHGIDIDSFTRLSGGFHFLQGGPFQGPDDVIVDDFYARQAKLNLGSQLTILSKSWRVCGIVEPGMLARIFVPLDELQRISANSDKVSTVYVKLDNPANTNEVVEQFKRLLPGYGIQTMEEIISQISVANIPMLQEFIYVVIGLAVLVGFLVVFLSMYTAVLERTREIGILKALGASPPYIANVLLRETLGLAIVGSILGILGAFGTKWILNEVLHSTLVQAIVPDWWLRAAAIAIFGAILGASYPGMKAARQNAIEALSYE